MTDLSGIDPPRMDWSSADLPSTFRTFRQYCELIFKGPLRGARHIRPALDRAGRPKHIQHMGNDDSRTKAPRPTVGPVR